MFRTTPSAFAAPFRLLAHPGLVFYIVSWLMVLLVLGTMAQRYVGLYAATQSFFYAWVLWIGPVPTPGGIPTLGLLTLGLAAKLFTATIWSRAQAGIIITHIGALMLMLGGLLTFLYAEEGQMTLFEGDRSGYVTAYHERELVIEDAATMALIARHPWATLGPGHKIEAPLQGVAIEILKMCRNCDFPQRQGKVDDNIKGRAQQFDITPAPLEIEDEANRSALLFRLSGSGPEKDGVHLTADFIDQSPWFEKDGKTYNIALRKKRFSLPFQIELKDFTRTLHAGTNMARSYTSDVLVHDNGTTWSATIRMNEPLRYRGYTFYQSSFIQDGAREASVLAVVRNSGRIFPYLASLVIALGLIIHLIVRHKPDRKRRMTHIVVMVAGLMMGMGGIHAPPVNAQEQKPPLDLSTFAQLPILDHGRIKPLDTFARSLLEEFSGRDHINDRAAIHWLADTVFRPDALQDVLLFRIQNSAVREALKIRQRQGNRYSLDDILPGLDAARALWEPLLATEQNKLSLPQKQILELIENIDLYMELSRALSLLVPAIQIDHPGILTALGLGNTATLSYLDLVERRDRLKSMLEALAKRTAQEDASKAMAPNEMALIDLVARMQSIDSNRALILFRVIPSPDHSDSWKTPWAVFQQDPKSPVLAEWRDLAAAYRAHDQNAFDTVLQKIQMRTTSDIQPARLSAEHFFNKLAPFWISLLFYTGALVAGALAMAFPAKEKIRTSGMAFLAIAILLHLTGLLFRVYLTGRPPVTNLYDSIIFVGVIATIFSFFMEHRTRDRTALLLGALIGTALQSIGLKFDAEGDTMRVLMAVLDTNFWLSTHVTTITIGYAFSILAALYAHTILVRSAFMHLDLNKNLSLITPVLSLGLAALLFTVTGTILGGIWADQSWGRFWGWDPKENGALLIVLWLIWSFHGRYSGHLPPVFFLSAIATLTIIVAAAWFGVNLLGVGLHSYGFTESAMTGFFMFCLLDFTFILALVVSILVRKNHV